MVGCRFRYGERVYLRVEPPDVFECFGEQSFQSAGGERYGERFAEYYRGSHFLGATILYVGSNTDEVVDFRVVYHTGAAADGSSVSSGYYVWRNGVLIGEALSSTGAGFAGLQAGALQGGGVLAGVTDLSWSNSGAFAADYTGLAAADKDAKGTERLSNSSLDSSTVPSTSWVVDWPTGATVIAKSSLADVRTDINNLGTTVNARVTGEVLNGASSATASFITSTTASSAYIELAGTWKAAANSIISSMWHVRPTGRGMCISRSARGQDRQ